MKDDNVYTPYKKEVKRDNITFCNLTPFLWHILENFVSKMTQEHQ